MTIVKVSASSADRIFRCEAAGALPRITDANDEDVDVKNKSDPREKGHDVHRFLERLPIIGREAALAEIENEANRAICADIELAKLSMQLGLSREVALAYNFRDDTARVLDLDDNGRAEIDRECEIHARVDILGVSAATRTVYVGDYKTGRGWLPAPEQSIQLGIGALAAARINHARSAQVEYIRIRDDGTVRKFGAMLDSIALDAAATRITEKMRNVFALRDRVLAGGEIPNTVEGPWCKYCESRQHCPAKTALIRAVLADPQPVPYTIPLTPERATQAYTMLRKTKELLKQVESALHAYAKIEPIKVGMDDDGSERWFGELVRDGNEELDGMIAHRVLTELLDGEIANKLVTMETSKRAINDELRKHSQLGDTEKKKQEKVYGRIRELGGVSRPLTKTTTEFTISAGGDAKARKRKQA